MEVVGESVWKLAFGLAKLDQKLAQDIASEVVLLAFDLNESGTPEDPANEPFTAKGVKVLSSPLDIIGVL